MKGTTWGSVARWPLHPFADMHGLVRVCVRTDTRTGADHTAAKFGAQFTHWQPSLSIVEQDLTQHHYGELHVCPLPLAYLSVTHYQVAPRHLLLSEIRKQVEEGSRLKEDTSA